MSALCASDGVGYSQLLGCMNEITSGLFGVTILFGLWILIYFRNRTYASARDAVATASFITFLAAVLLRVLGAIDDVYLGIVFVLLAGSAAVLAYRS